MSLVRVGLSETKDFADGYDAIFGKKAEKKEEKTTEAPANQDEPATAEAKDEYPKNPFRKGSGLGC